MVGEGHTRAVGTGGALVGSMALQPHQILARTEATVVTPSTAVEEVLIIKKKLKNFLVPECSLGLKLSYETHIILF